MSCGALASPVISMLHLRQVGRQHPYRAPNECPGRFLGCRRAFPELGGWGRRVCAVVAASTEGSEEPSIRELSASLERAIDEEEYELAASIRDQIERKRRDARAVVEEANERFYSAFRNGDYVAMSRIWGNGEHVQCIHPVAECIAGREDVLKSWKLILSGGRLDIKLEDVRVYATDTMGYVTAVEVVNAEDSKGRIVATNVFERQGSEWKIVFHQGGVC